MFYYTYVLLCIKNGNKKQQFYTGSTSNLLQRIKDHKSGSTKSTKDFDIIKLVYYEACLNKTDSRKRELQLKTGFGRGYINRRIKSYLDARV